MSDTGGTGAGPSASFSLNYTHNYNLGAFGVFSVDENPNGAQQQQQQPNPIGGSNVAVPNIAVINTAPATVAQVPDGPVLGPLPTTPAAINIPANAFGYGAPAAQVVAAPVQVAPAGSNVNQLNNPAFKEAEKGIQHLTSAFQSLPDQVKHNVNIPITSRNVQIRATLRDVTVWEHSHRTWRDPQLFIADVVRYAELTGQDKIDMLARHVNDRMRQTFTLAVSEIRATGSEVSWEKACEIFTHIAGLDLVQAAEKARHSLVHGLIKQKPGQAVIDYACVMRQQFTLAKISDVGLQCEYFLSGLRPDLQPACARTIEGHYWSNLHACVLHAVAEEAKRPSKGPGTVAAIAPQPQHATPPADPDCPSLAVMRLRGRFARNKRALQGVSNHVIYGSTAGGRGAGPGRSASSGSYDHQPKRRRFERRAHERHDYDRDDFDEHEPYSRPNKPRQGYHSSPPGQHYGDRNRSHNGGNKFHGGGRGGGGFGGGRGGGGYGGNGGGGGRRGNFY